MYIDEYTRIAEVEMDSEAYVSMIAGIFKRKLSADDVLDIFGDCSPFVTFVFGRDDGNQVTPVIGIDFNSDSRYIAEISYWFYDKVLSMFTEMKWDEISKIGDLIDVEKPTTW
jgi:hypothetical protein